jgi:hypothetical protein
MRIELTFPDQSQGTADLKSGTGTSSVTSPRTTSLEIQNGINNEICCTDYT